MRKALLSSFYRRKNEAQRGGPLTSGHKESKLRNKHCISGGLASKSLQLTVMIQWLPPKLLSLTTVFILSESEKYKCQSRSTLQPHGLYPASLLCSWNSPGKNIWNGQPFPSPGNLPNLGLKRGLLHSSWTLCHLSHQGSPFISTVTMHGYLCTSSVHASSFQDCVILTGKNSFSLVFSRT